MQPLIDGLWKLIESGIEYMKLQDKNIMDNNQDFKKKFEDNFESIYKSVLDYMQDETESLDRHKVAAIMMIAIIKSDILHTIDSTNQKFMGNYILATDCGLSYMISELNKRLNILIKREIEAYIFPEALACETNYYRIFYRNLYFANNNKEWGLNPLDIAERLFLLEYMTLEKNGIDPSILKEY